MAGKDKMKKYDRKTFTIRYRVNENNEVSFFDPSCDEIPGNLFFKLMKALTEVENEWNKENNML